MKFKKQVSISLALLMIIHLYFSPLTVLAGESTDEIVDEKDTITTEESSEQETVSTETEDSNEENKPNDAGKSDATEKEGSDEQPKEVEEKEKLPSDQQSDIDKEPENKTEKQEEINYGDLVKSTIDDASEYINTLDYITEWLAIGLVTAGKAVPDQYESQFEQNIEGQITDGLETGRIKITDIERLAMAAVAIDKDPRDVQGHDLIELIYNSPDRNGSSDTMTFQGNNGPIFALVALDTKGFPVPDDARWTRQKLIDQLLETQNDNGSWDLNDLFDSPSIDITAMAIIGLSPYKDQPKVNEALDKTLNYLSSAQTDEGGFDGGPFVGGVTSEATSQAIIGLTAYGIDPTSEQFTKNGNNLIDHLLSFKNNDGGFKHTQGEGDSNAMGTEQALQGLVAYHNFLESKGPLYHFGKLDTSPEEPEDEQPDEPEEEEDPNPEENPEETEDPEKPGQYEEQEVSFDEPVVVKKGQKVTLKESNTTLVLPADLPEGTKLTITNETSKSDTHKQKIKAAGDIINFNFQYPNEEFKGDFELSLEINEDANTDKTGVYYLNEDTKEWEYYGGKGMAQDGLITIYVNHFSTYGVFEEVSEEHHIDNKDDPEGDEGEHKINDDENNIINQLEGVKQVDERSSLKLPETATNTFSFLLIGCILLVLGIITFFVRRKMISNKI